ncbi:formyltransferase family protein [Maricaulis salignorans]|uniref:phosphoribosylglycinamide formyltransferase 1 n=1 Tax=Maricaulis salignorans TaxID=144026 RepID=A0A1G9VG73_9PROT|nr:formyltransferase family protein [Maricaulis salignorans]SDM71204.1 methionyl-tRNA formyltransferase [Maricaulis salignorans]
MHVLILSPYPDSLIAPITARGDRVTVRSDLLNEADFAAIRPDWVVSYGYRRLITAPVLDLYAGRIVNLHISLLPYNRGADPNFWSWVDNTPKGVTLHLIDGEMDTGPILVQREVKLDPDLETLKSSYLRLRQEIEDVFARHWDAIASGQLPPQVQTTCLPMHRAADKTELFARLPQGWDTPARIAMRLLSGASSPGEAGGADGRGRTTN